MKEYKVNFNGKELIVKQDIDGKFIIPDIINEFKLNHTALKPAHEPMVLARKPVSEDTIAENVLKWGVGGLNIDGCRIATNEDLARLNKDDNGMFGFGKGANNAAQIKKEQGEDYGGRWPANIITDGSEEVKSVFPNTKARKRSPKNNKEASKGLYTPNECIYTENNTYGDEGSASRYFYCAKASKKDRNEGLDGFELKLQEAANYRPHQMEEALNGENGDAYGRYKPQANNHPTVKPTDLMAYLVRLVTPPNGTVLDPFNGSGSTGKACAREGFDYIGIDLSQEYLDISQARIDYEINKKANNNGTEPEKQE